MNENLKIWNTPEEMQIDLRRVYFSLPKREAILPDHIDFDNLTTIKKAGYFEQMAQEEARRMGSELTNRQLELLDKLLDRAVITQVLKQGIREEFEEYFKEGITAEEISIIRALGVGDEGFLQEGIFSKDPMVRIEIEKRYYDDLKADFNYFMDNPEEYIDDPGMIAEIGLKEARIELFELQFLQIYEVPISEMQGFKI